MIEKIKLKKIKTNHYVDQNNDLFLIVKNNENNYNEFLKDMISEEYVKKNDNKVNIHNEFLKGCAGK